jgi:hypothetical protein
VERIGLTREQALAHDLLDTDGKAELDGLPVPALDALVRKWIESNLDSAKARSVVEAEPRMRAKALALISVADAGREETASLETGSDWAWARSA